MVNSVSVSFFKRKFLINYNNKNALIDFSPCDNSPVFGDFEFVCEFNHIIGLFEIENEFYLLFTTKEEECGKFYKNGKDIVIYRIKEVRYCCFDEPSSKSPLHKLCKYIKNHDFYISTQIFESNCFHWNAEGLKLLQRYLKPFVPYTIKETAKIEGSSRIIDLERQLENLNFLKGISKSQCMQIDIQNAENSKKHPKLTTIEDLTGVRAQEFINFNKMKSGKRASKNDKGLFDTRHFTDGDSNIYREKHVSFHRCKPSESLVESNDFWLEFSDSDSSPQTERSQIKIAEFNQEISKKYATQKSKVYNEISDHARNESFPPCADDAQYKSFRSSHFSEISSNMNVFGNKDVTNPQNVDNDGILTFSESNFFEKQVKCFENIQAFIFCGFFGTQYRLGKTYNLLSLISKNKIGPRFYCRGINEKSDVSFFVQTTVQIYQHKKVIFEKTILRGSIPLFWYQDTNPLRKTLKYSREADVTDNILKKHFMRLNDHYASKNRRLIVINLLSSRCPNERKLTCDYEELLAKNGIPFITFDLNKYSSNYAQMTYLLFQEIEYVCGTSDAIFRVNCLDCLDRTNIAQNIICEYLVSKSSVEFNKESAIKIFKSLFVRNGHALSNFYAGSDSLKSDLVANEKRSLGGRFDDVVINAHRIFKGTYSDKNKFQCIKIFLQKNSISERYVESNALDNMGSPQNIMYYKDFRTFKPSEKYEKDLFSCEKKLSFEIERKQKTKKCGISKKPGIIKDTDLLNLNKGTFNVHENDSVAKNDKTLCTYRKDEFEKLSSNQEIPLQTDNNLNQYDLNKYNDALCQRMPSLTYKTSKRIVFESVNNINSDPELDGLNNDNTGMKFFEQHDKTVGNASRSRNDLLECCDNSHKMNFAEKKTDNLDSLNKSTNACKPYEKKNNDGSLCSKKIIIFNWCLNGISFDSLEEIPTIHHTADFFIIFVHKISTNFRKIILDKFPKERAKCTDFFKDYMFKNHQNIVLISQSYTSHIGLLFFAEESYIHQIHDIKVQKYKKGVLLRNSALSIKFKIMDIDLMFTNIYFSDDDANWEKRLNIYINELKICSDPSMSSFVGGFFKINRYNISLKTMFNMIELQNYAGFLNEDRVGEVFHEATRGSVIEYPITFPPNGNYKTNDLMYFSRLFYPQNISCIEYSDLCDVTTGYRPIYGVYLLSIDSCNQKRG